MIIELLGATRREDMLVLPFVYSPSKIPLVPVRIAGTGVPIGDDAYMIWDSGAEANVLEKGAVVQAGAVYIPTGPPGSATGVGGKSQSTEITSATFKVGKHDFNAPIHVLPHVSNHNHVVGALGFPYFYENSHHITIFEGGIYVSTFSLWNK